MPSTRRSSTKSGAAKRAPSTPCALTKSSSTSATSSDPPPAAPADQPLDDVEHQIVAWILDGHSEFDLRSAIAAKFPERVADQLLARAARHFQVAGGDDPDAIRGFAIEAYREIYRRTLEIGDFTTAMKALDRLRAVAR